MVSSSDRYARIARFRISNQQSTHHKGTAGVGCDGFHPQIPVDLSQEAREEIVKFLEKVEQSGSGRNKRAQPCFSWFRWRRRDTDLLLGRPRRRWWLLKLFLMGVGTTMFQVFFCGIPVVTTGAIGPSGPSAFVRRRTELFQPAGANEARFEHTGVHATMICQ